MSDENGCCGCLIYILIALAILAYFGVVEWETVSSYIDFVFKIFMYLIIGPVLILLFLLIKKIFDSLKK
jgi:hypothetical protein